VRRPGPLQVLQLLAAEAVLVVGLPAVLMRPLEHLHRLRHYHTDHTHNKKSNTEET